MRDGQVEPIEVLCRHRARILEIIAEPIRHWLECGERMDIGLLLRSVRAPRREGNRHDITCILRRLPACTRRSFTHQIARLGIARLGIAQLGPLRWEPVSLTDTAIANTSSA